MSTKKLQNYLRTFRKRACLSQDEVAYVLGCKSGSKISRYENCSRLPSTETLFAYEVLFGSPAKVLFAGRYLAAKQKTLARIRVLERRISKAIPMPISQRKLELLRAAVAAQRTITLKQ